MKYCESCCHLLSRFLKYIYAMLSLLHHWILYGCWMLLGCCKMLWDDHYKNLRHRFHYPPWDSTCRWENVWNLKQSFGSILNINQTWRDIWREHQIRGQKQLERVVKGTHSTRRFGFFASTSLTMLWQVSGKPLKNTRQCCKWYQKRKYMGICFLYVLESKYWLKRHCQQKVALYLRILKVDKTWQNMTVDCGIALDKWNIENTFCEKIIKGAWLISHHHLPWLIQCGHVAGLSLSFFFCSDSESTF